MNLEEIAKLAGVSRSTVSRVVNDHPNVSQATRDRVLRVIEQTHYRPNAAARLLVTQQSRVISLVVPQAIASTFTDPYFPILIQSVMQQAQELDFAVLMWLGSNSENAERFSNRVLQHSLFDGVLIAAAVNDDPLIPRLVEDEFPFVIIGPPPLHNLNYVDVDNVNAAETAVLHLIHLGWQRIGTITGPLNMGAAVARLTGYRNAFKRAGKPIDETLIVEGNFDETSGYEGMQLLLERGVNAVFCASDIMAFGALRAIADCGLRTPENIGIVGFDDLPFASATFPALTTVRQPIQALGSIGTQMLIDLLNGLARPPYQKILPASLVVRDSCGAHRM